MLVVAQPQHLRQGDEPQKDDFTTDDAGHCRHDHRHHGCNDGDAAPEPTKRDIQRIVHILGDPASLQQRRHHDEQGNGDDRVGDREVVDPLHDETEARHAKIEVDHQRAEKPGRKPQGDAGDEENKDPDQEQQGKCADIHA